MMCRRRAAELRHRKARAVQDPTVRACDARFPMTATGEVCKVEMRERLVQLLGLGPPPPPNTPGAAERGRRHGCCRTREGAMLVDNCGGLWIAIGQLAVPARCSRHGDTLGARRLGSTVSRLERGGHGGADPGPVAGTKISAHLPGCVRAGGTAIDPRGAVPGRGTHPAYRRSDHRQVSRHTARVAIGADRRPRRSRRRAPYPGVPPSRSGFAPVRGPG